MKVIKYTFEGSSVEMGWNEINEDIAAMEADNGEYRIEVVADTEALNKEE